ncbi:MAG: TraB/GumN family protein [Oscillospiraceae bacterium]|nr:TraB/GumN family protein [Oscillospiraceae bacterium]
MKKIVVLLLVFTLIIGLAACTSETVDDGITGALHRVEYGDNVAYIFGTFHASRPHWFPLADVVEDALRRADVVAMEIEEIGLGAGAMRRAVANMMYLPNSLTWSEYLTDEAYNHFIEVLKTWNVVYEHVNTMSPIALILSLEQGIIINSSDLDVGIEAAVDGYIADIAIELGLPVIGLESLEQQTNIFYNPPFEVTMAGIMRFRSREEFMEFQFQDEVASLNKLADYYENNDFASITASFAVELNPDEDCLYTIYMREYMLGWRSTYYAHEIMRLLQETEEPTTFFVAVGLGHVINSRTGDEFTDIVQQLVFAGFVVTPLY